ncbi:hypothetical protein [Aeromicrobium sp. IC_218]|uniref:ORC-CDC6 family AAA ATPase n=1 Tax=Aeromicrobium sp. IC_218 TaxID=2545468 RepID=UPI00103E064F|nr:hypothetical protein [Aeromicrobium sp. IC_218]TCJ00805.1 hypothetical protein E0W78_01625 [Aeromicrobium sp. IC_218]
MDTKILLSALQEVEKRAERVSEDDVLATYVNVESLTAALSARDNGIIFGRRGTGKTHALKYVAQTEREKGNRVVFIDMEQDVGSTEGRYADPNLSISERATRLVVDVLSIVHTQLLEAAFAGDIRVQIDVLDRMLDHFREVLVAQETEHEDTQTDRSARGSTTNAGVRWAGGMPALRLGEGATRETAHEEGVRTRQTGVVRHRIHFGGVIQSMRQAIEADDASRFWLLIDEWSGIPIDLQPYVAEMLRRLFFGIPKVSVRIAAIPHRSEWRIAGERGDYIGAEVGAELFPLLDLDEFVVFPARSREEQAQRSLSFFRALLFRHISTAVVGMGEEPPESEADLIGSLFTQVTSLQEVIRAAEGVPRDALSIVGRAGLRAGGSKIAVAHVRESASQLYTTTKAAQLNGIPIARALLDRILSDVISGRKARAFLIKQDQTQDPLVQQLVDDRILHIIKRGWSGKDNPGERYDVLQIDYGCYVHLLGTNAAPQSLLGGDDEDEFSAVVGDVEVPDEDYRAIRRAILDLPTMLADIDGDTGGHPTPSAD